MKLLKILIVVVAWLLIPAMGYSGVTIGNLDNDPVYGTVGFARTHWISSINRIAVYLIPGSQTVATSVRILNPSASAGSQWSYAWPENSLGIHSRDNPASFYIPALNEMWVWNGAYLETVPGGSHWGGRFSFAGCTPTPSTNCGSWTTRSALSTTGSNVSSAFTGVLDMSENGGLIPWEGLDPAMAWAANINTGALIGGSSDGGIYTYIFEPKSGGPEAYIVRKLSIPRPTGPRAQCMNCMVSDGTDFYLAFGYKQTGDSVAGNWQDLWKLSKSTGSWVWTQLASPPDTVYTPMLTYDSTRNTIVSWLKNTIIEYSIANNAWTVLAGGITCRTDMTASYDPISHKHVYMGGNTNGLTTFDVNCLSGGGTQTQVFYADLTNATPLPAGCEAESGLAGRTDILRCEPFESSTWYSNTNWSFNRGSPGFPALAPSACPIASITGICYGDNYQNGISINTPGGTGTLRYVAASHTLSWQAPGSTTAGTPVNISTDATCYLLRDGDDPTKTYAINTNFGAYGALPVSDTTKSITITASTWNGTRTNDFNLGNFIGSMDTSVSTSYGCISGNCLQKLMYAWNNPKIINHTADWLSAALIIPGIGGCSHVTVGCIPQQEIYARYYLKLSPNWDARGYSTADGTPCTGYICGGKFPGLGDATDTTYGCGNGGDFSVTGTECWSLRLTYQSCSDGINDACAEDGVNSNTRIGYYPYGYNGENPNDPIRFGFVPFDDNGRGLSGAGSWEDGPCSSTYRFSGGRHQSGGSSPYCGIGPAGITIGVWHLIELHVKMNTCNATYPNETSCSQNGIMEAWVDGTLKYQKTNVNFRNGPTGSFAGHNNIGIRQFWMDVYEGGTSVAMKEDMYVYLDQIVIGTVSRIGEIGGGLPATTPNPPTSLIVKQL